MATDYKALEQELMEEYPETIEEFKKIQQEDYEVFLMKQADYGISNISMGTMLQTNEDLRLSLTGLVVRLNDKIQRLINLVMRSNKKPQNEALEDSFLDASNYGVIARIVLNGKWGK